MSDFLKKEQPPWKPPFPRKYTAHDNFSALQNDRQPTTDEEREVWLGQEEERFLNEPANE